MNINNELKSTILYCQKKDGRYTDFFPSKLCVEMCGAEKKDIIQVKVSQAYYNEPTTHYGWWDNNDNAFCLIFDSYDAFSVCFPYGYKEEEKRGVGKAYSLKVEEIN